MPDLLDRNDLALHYKLLAEQAHRFATQAPVDKWDYWLDKEDEYKRKLFELAEAKVVEKKSV